MASVSEDGDTSRCSSVGKSLQVCGFLSVMFVQEICDEKRRSLWECLSSSFRQLSVSKNGKAQVNDTDVMKMQIRMLAV